MKYKLTILCPGIRVANWERLYRSIETSFSGSWEIIFIGPYDIPQYLKETLYAEGKDNFKYIKDWGSPIRCQQIGLTFSDGEYINWAADDGVFLPGALDVGFRMLENLNYKTVVMGKYYEGNNDGDMPMQDTKYYVLSNHDASRSKYIPTKYLMLNVGLVSRQLLMEVGGWDASTFEVCPMAYNDLAIRLQRYSCNFIVQDDMMFKCSHLPGHAGDHGPIHDGQVYHDQPAFMDIYEDEGCINRITIPIDNWQSAPEKWQRRFGK